MPFNELGLSDKVLAAVADTGYTEPTPIQAQAIPHILARRDVLGLAQTGTGKTAAFTLPMLTLLEQGRARARMPRTLILEPTRELAAQVEENFTRYGKNHKLNVALLIGGVSFGDQDAKLLRGVDILIATPGRLLDHVERGRLLLSGIEILVIDEADRMLDMGFIPDIERVCKLVPFTRQTLFFSATMPPEIQRLVSQFLSNPVQIEASRPSSTASTITQLLVPSAKEDFAKRETLRGLIDNAEALQNGIIFCNRKSEVAVVHKSLLRHGYKAVCLHGDMDQRSRMQALDQFRTGEATLLVASDVAARGLDIPAVSHVFNYDTPHHAEDYVHRIGRTGRAGRAGAAFTIVTAGEVKSLAAIEKLIGRPIDWKDGSGLDSVPAADPRTRPTREKPSRGEKPPREKGRGSRSPAREDAGESRGARPARRRSGEDKPVSTGEELVAAAPVDVGSETATENRTAAAKPARRRGRAKDTEAAPAAAAPAIPAAPRERSREKTAPAPARAPVTPLTHRRPDRAPMDEPADTSHLPAFLLRPVKIKAG
ncbi:DEAD/DEAH box helicase [Ancylobacter dichloromethanicus]|uniref:DEAD-box ATP-dependent RNA helicase RhpA n=1 Tax=Ancylobacter dichloromethanicus TaxID=518825 RepID=A0A9W6J8K4_9HYPH|nr:DEAD/DEAH box helicase [Ancylobacter dichloromethanicus]MBS7555795.1 DEAD/DEAH box helicase [Ancylobacter dichloromethanicus]GLK72870.1 DEAD/DEAH box helicase [Ancylobacter dichloromethanicus]